MIVVAILMEVLNDRIAIRTAELAEFSIGLVILVAVRRWAPLIAPAIVAIAFAFSVRGSFVMITGRLRRRMGFSLVALIALSFARFCWCGQAQT